MLTYPGNARVAYYILLSCPQHHSCLPCCLSTTSYLSIHSFILLNKAVNLCLCLSMPAERSSHAASCSRSIQVSRFDVLGSQSLRLKRLCRWNSSLENSLLKLTVVSFVLSHTENLTVLSLHDPLFFFDWQDNWEQITIRTFQC